MQSIQVPIKKKDEYILGQIVEEINTNKTKE